VEFEWDEVKSDACRGTRGFDFQFATGVFGDRLKRAVEDDRFDYGERRIRVTGQIDGIVYVVVYTLRSGRCRVISARRGNRREVEAYGAG
jgi:uncharacterized DUF497 family protein